LRSLVTSFFCDRVRGVFDHGSGANALQNGRSAGTYNPNTGRAAKSQTNSNGVTTTQTSNGGRAKTKNGMGIAQAPGGKTCAKTANHQGCN
jgi:hypothetical protein